MIPIRDINPVRTKPLVLYVIIGINVAVWFYQVQLSAVGGGDAMQAFVLRFGVVPKAFVTGSLGSLVTPVTSMFMHGGWLHIIGNMWFLWVFGDNVEDKLGPRRFLLFYVLSGVIAALAQVVINPESNIPMVGASGAVSGILAAYVMLFPRAKVVTLIPIFFFLHFARIPAAFFIFIWFGMQLLNASASLVTIGEDTGGTAFFAHVGGFVGGLAMVWWFLRDSRKPPKARKHKVHHQPRQDSHRPSPIASKRPQAEPPKRRSSKGYDKGYR